MCAKKIQIQLRLLKKIFIIFKYGHAFVVYCWDVLLFLLIESKHEIVCGFTWIVQQFMYKNMYNLLLSGPNILGGTEVNGPPANCELRKKNRTRARTLTRVQCACKKHLWTCVRCAIAHLHIFAHFSYTLCDILKKIKVFTYFWWYFAIKSFYQKT